MPAADSVSVAAFFVHFYQGKEVIVYSIVEKAACGRF